MGDYHRGGVYGGCEVCMFVLMFSFDQFTCDCPLSWANFVSQMGEC